MTTGLVFDIRKFSIHDGPGIRTTVFFKGCPLACMWCHNPEGQSYEPELVERRSRCINCGTCLLACPEGGIHLVEGYPATDRQMCVLCGTCVEDCPSEARQIAGRRMSAAQVMEQIERDLPFYESSGGGVTFSGGEPLAQSDFLLELLIACRALDLHTTLDTSGYAPWHELEKVREYVDLFLYDLKIADGQAHLRYTGVSNQQIVQNLRALSSNGHRIIVRVPVVPGITDSHQNMAAIGRLASDMNTIERIDLLPYHPSAEGKYTRLGMDYELAGLSAPDEALLAGLANSIQKFGIKVNIGG